MKTAQQQRDAARNRKREERARYRKAGLIAKTVQIPDTFPAKVELEMAVVDINRKYS